MKSFTLPKMTFWRVVGVIIVSAGLYSTYLRITQGLSITNLSDQFPWGLWIGFDILCGVGLAAGGFTICAITHIFNIEKYKPLARPAILTAFLGYLLVIFGLMYDLGKPYNIWHAIIMWNPRSVMFEVAWCVMLYTTVLFLEFAPMLLEKFKLTKTLQILKKLSIAVMILGIILSTLHQSSLGSLFLIVPTKMNTLWYSSLLPVYFYLSAIGAGLAMVIFESYTSARAFGKGIELDLLSRIGFFSAIVLAITLVLKITDLYLSNKLQLLAEMNQQSLMFSLEIFIGIIIPFGFLVQRKLRENKTWLYISAALIVAGFLLNRLNVSITAISSVNGINYFPSVHEVIISLMLIVLGMWAFRLLVKFLPVMEEQPANIDKVF
jgi:Ni/Fe-hydrogenase subunit HybB-like protein